MASQAVAKIEEWRRDFDAIYNEVVMLWHKRHLFREVMEIYARGVKARVEDHTFENWLVDNYVVTIAVGIRRQADLRKDVVSMARLLINLAANATLLTREWYVAQHDDAFWKWQGHKNFDEFAPDSAPRASRDLIGKDQERLQAVSEGVRRLVDERFAHHAREARYGAVTFAQVHAALDEIGGLLKRYSLLLRQTGLVTPEPVIQGDWQAVFRIPWLREDEGALPS